LQLAAGVVLMTYLSLCLVDQALGVWSLDLSGRSLTLVIRLWHSAPGTVLLYGSAGLHFALALRTVYERRHWTLPLAEWIRLWAGLSLPVLLVRHAVATRLAASLYGFEPDCTKIVVTLITSGPQGLQLSLPAPRWVHGCLGLWIRFRHYPFVRRAVSALIAVLVILPSLSAAGYIQITRAVLAANAFHLIQNQSWSRTVLFSMRGITIFWPPASRWSLAPSSRVGCATDWSIALSETAHDAWRSEMQRNV
jgi:adenylate cyclase